jgi:circadian clock protein KaiC
MQDMEITPPTLAATGIEGLDELLLGGLPQQHMYLIQGEAGTGKTTIGMQFLLEGVRAGETALFVSLAETRDDLLEVAASHGWTLDGIDIYEVTAEEAAQRLARTQTVFPTAEVELTEVTDEIIEVLFQTRPQRVLFDAVTELRLLADSPVRYRHQVLALRNALGTIGATSLLTDTVVKDLEDRVLDSLVHGIIRMERWVPTYGTARRRLEVSKLRGKRYLDGWHDFSIETGGVEVYPRPRTRKVEREPSWRQLASGVAELDQLLGGGLEMGTAVLIAGGSGTGKSSLSSLFMRSGLEAGLRGAYFVFDERPRTLYKRSADIGLALEPYVEDGRLAVRSVETGTISPGAFGDELRRLVEEEGVKIVVLDSLTGYLRAMPEEVLLVNQMHDLLTYLSQQGVLSILVVTHHGLIGTMTEQVIDLSYLSDTVIVTSHFVASGAVHKALSVMKKRHGWHEKTIRELRIDQNGIAISEPLDDATGALGGYPEFLGDRSQLLKKGGDASK